MATALMMGVAGCGGGDAADEEVGADDLAFSVSTLPTEPLEEPPVIGLAVQNLDRTFFQGLEAGALGQAASSGATLVVTDAGDDEAQQLADVEALIDQGVHGIVLSPVNSEAAVDIAALAAERGVPLLAVANQIGTVEEYGSQFVYPGTVALVTNDDVDMGRKAAAFAADRIGDEAVGIAVLEGKEGTANAVMRRDGFRAELEALAIDFVVIASISGDWTGDGGAEACRTFGETEGIDMIYSMSDAMTAGCIDALDEAGIDDIDIVSIGGNADGVALLGDGSMLGTVCQKPGTMGALAVSTMIEALATAEFEQGLRFYETPVVTAENQTEVCIPQW